MNLFGHNMDPEKYSFVIRWTIPAGQLKGWENFQMVNPESVEKIHPKEFAEANELIARIKARL